MTTAPKLIREQLLALADELQSAWNSTDALLNLDGFADRLRSLAAEPVGGNRNDAAWCLSQILHDLPTNRDWLDKNLESFAREVVRKADPTQPDSAEGAALAIASKAGSDALSEYNRKLRATDEGKGEQPKAEGGALLFHAIKLASRLPIGPVANELNYTLAMLSAAPQPEPYHREGCSLTGVPNLLASCPCGLTQPEQPARDGVIGYVSSSAIASLIPGEAIRLFADNASGRVPIYTQPPQHAYDTHQFKNFHRSLCARFGYNHDEIFWRRDFVSLEEHIAKLIPQQADGGAVGWFAKNRFDAWEEVDEQHVGEEGVVQLFTHQPKSTGVSEEMVERLARYIYHQESLNCKDLEAAIYHQTNWRRAIPEARKMLLAAFGGEK